MVHGHHIEAGTAPNAVPFWFLRLRGAESFHECSTFELELFEPQPSLGPPSSSGAKCCSQMLAMTIHSFCSLGSELLAA